MASVVRPARPGDLSAVLALAVDMHREAPAYRQRPFDREKVARLLGGLCAGTLAELVLFVVERGGEVVGGLIGGISTDWFCAEKVAFELALFVAPARRDGRSALLLVRAFTEWARASGAALARAGSTTGVDPEGTARLYVHAGFRVVGPMLVYDLERNDVHRC